MVARGLGVVIFFAERATVNEPFGEAVSLNLPHEGQGAPWLSDDQLTLFFEVTWTIDTVLATRADRGAPFMIEESFGGYTDPFVAGGPNGTLYVEQNRELEFASLSNWIPGSFESLGIGGIRPTLTADELTLYFSRDANNPWTLVAVRDAVDEAFGEATAAGIDSEFADAPSWISPDGCRLYFDTWYDASADLYVAERPLP
jgi:hypothetical protein